MSKLTPISRHVMQQLKSQKDADDRIDKINSIVEGLYNKAVHSASTTTDMKLNSPIPRLPSKYPLGRPIPENSPAYDLTGSSDPFYLNNMEQILAALQKLFPGCSVTHALMARGRDGKLYDLSKLDDSALPFVDQTLEQSFIVIDWS